MEISLMSGQQVAERRVALARELEGLVAKHNAGTISADESARVLAINEETSKLVTRAAEIERDRVAIETARGHIQAAQGISTGITTPQSQGAPRIEMGQRKLTGKAAEVFGSVEDGKLAAGFLLAVKNGDQAWFTRNAAAFGGADVQASMNTRDNPSGGFLVPPAFELAIIKLRNTRGVFRREAMGHQMAGDKLPVNKWVSGPTAYWVSENPSADLTESEPVYGQVTLNARKLATLVPVTEELINDSAVDIAANIAEDMAWALANAEDLAGFLGDGTSTYGDNLGIVHLLGLAAHAGSVVTATSQTSVGAVTDAFVTKLRGRLPQHSRAGAKWYCSGAVAQELFERLARGAGGVTYREMREGGGEVLVYAGREVVEVDVMSSEPASGAIAAVLGNLRNGSKFGEVRGGMTLEYNPVYNFRRGVKAWKLQERVAILNHDMGGTTAASAGAICGLKLG